MCRKKPIALIVEDQGGIRAVWRRALEPLDMEIWEADNLREALEMSSKIPPPDLILLDLRLGDSNDMSTIGAIPTFKKGNPDVVIIVISGYATPEIATLAIQQGAHGIREKLDMNRSAELWAEIQLALKSAPKGAQKALEFTSDLIAKLSKTLVL